ncbi:MAG: T9SS type A sorting domain-containing protein [Bacteroidota bacterium]
MKTLLPFFILTACINGLHANSLLQNPSTGPLNNSKLADISIAANATDVVLLAADASFVYAIDLADNNAADANANTVTSIADFVAGKLIPIAGQSLTIKTIVVNPISKAVYILATSGGTTSYIFKVKNNGADITLLDLTNIKHSKISWGGTFTVNDMTWGNNTLYISSGSFSLNGEIGWMQAPFVHNSAMTKRATSMFKSNWGGQYFTAAPLETMVYGSINNTPRLMGVTTCAPGFSADITNLTGSGVLQVTEDFNVNSGVSSDVVFQKNNGKSWLFDLHDGSLYRIGEKYLDGSRVPAMEFNSNSVLLRDGVNPAPGVPDDEFKKYAGNYRAIALWDDSRLLLLETGNGALKMMTTTTTGIHDPEKAVEDIKVYPNPVSGFINIQLPANIGKGIVSVYDINGRLVLKQQAEVTDTKLDLGKLSKGNYSISFTDTEGKMISSKIIIVE